MAKTKKTLTQKRKDAILRAEAAYYGRVADMMQALPTFARDVDEGEWKALGIGKRVYEEADVAEMQETAMKLYYTDPSASGIIDTMVNFVVGRDAHITPVDENQKVKDWWAEFSQVNEFDTRMKELVRRCFRDGEAFLRFFKSKQRGGVPLVRFVEPDMVADPNHKHSFGIQTDPEDVETVIRYLLKDGKSIKAADMIHTKIRVDSNVKRGVSFLVGIAKYIVKYGSWLDDRIMLNKIRTMFNMVVKVTGISPSTFGEKFADVTGKSSIGGTAKKRMPKSGSVLVATPGVDYDFKNLQIHAPDTAADGRLIELQVAKGTNLTEYVVRADSSNSNYSSTMVSESPMVRNFQAWQDVFEKPFKKIFTKVIEIGIKLGKIPRGSNTECNVNFAGLIHRDIKEETEAYVMQIMEQLVSRRTVSETLGYNYETEKVQIEKELKEEADNEYKSRNKEENDGGDEDE